MTADPRGGDRPLAALNAGAEPVAALPFAGGGTPVAALPMYDWPEVREATDALWSTIAKGLRERGFDPPARLKRGFDAPGSLDLLWRDPRLLLAQTCGFPYATRLIDTVSLVGTPAYDAPGCDGPLYRSAIVTRRGAGLDHLKAFSGRRLAFNAEDSLSGRVAFLAALRASGVEEGAFEPVMTGSHRASLVAVATGEADAAALDAVCLALARDHEKDAVAAVAIVAWTPPLPGLPLVTARRPEAEVAAIAASLTSALGHPATAEGRRALYLEGFHALDKAAYRGLRGLAA